VTTNDYTPELADALALVMFGRGACVEAVGGKFVVARYRRELNEAIRPAGAYTRTVLAEGATRREALELGERRRRPKAPSERPSPPRC
jgi:hypothetical protein